MAVWGNQHAKGKFKGNRIELHDDYAIVFDHKGEEIIIDSEDIPIVKMQTWCVSQNGRSKYASTTVNRFKRVTLECFLLCPLSPYVVDHIDRNGLNCRRKNLRIASPTQNARNRRRSSSNTSRFKGVTFDQETKKWKARLRVKGQAIHLGYHPTAEAAAAWYDAAALYYFGEWAALNSEEHDLTAFDINAILAGFPGCLEKIPFSSSYRGVSRRKKGDGYGKWRATILVQGRHIELGSYETEAGAAKAYNEAALRYFGERAKLNVIPPKSKNGQFEFDF